MANDFIDELFGESFESQIKDRLLAAHSFSLAPLVLAYGLALVFALQLGIMMNARIEPDTRGAVKPYAGVGAGVAITRRNDHSLRERTGDVAPAGQAMAGFAMGISSRTAVFAEYRYFKAFEQSEAAANGGGKTGSHAGLLGLRVRLGGPIQ